MSLRRNFDGVTKGLWAQALISSYSFLSENTNRSKSFAVFQQSTVNGVNGYQQFGTNGTQANTTFVAYQNRQTYLEGAIGYNRNFGLHGIDAQIRATSDNTINNSELALQYYGGAGRVSYNFDKRYIAEFGFGLNRTNRYPPGTPFGFFPSAGLTWNMAQEKFFPKTTWLNELRLFATYGKTGNDVAGYYIYNQYYGGGSSYYFGTGPTTYGGLALNTLANTNITWEKANKLNLGLKADLLKNKLFLQVEYYNNKYYDLLSNPNISSIVGIEVQNLNIGINRYSGSEVQLNWQQSLGKFSYYINGNASLLKTQILYQNEVFRQYAYLQRTGQPVGQPFGYIADGLFQSQAEINQSAKIAGYSPIPGDIKYKDLNSDGVIDQFDQTTLGTTKPLIYYGSTLGFAYKGFDFSALVQGVANRNLLLTGSSVWEFQNNGFGQAYEQNLNRWTPATAATATYPRVSIGTNINNNIVSSYWMHSGDYIRLKNIEVGYSLPFGFVNRIKLSSFRIFVNGTNLLTHSAYNLVDPETNGGAYPIQKVINGGVNIKF
ncbi:MAG: SusC/RagA family TonB-linked outer membrane protein [Sphingobacteriaceae bacterium]|nr:MAG: SusC/RagA family TonB-linked outer membrane protein [Sphingobacteriaceae bacterium]